MSDQSKRNKSLLQELPYYNVNIALNHGQFNNLTQSCKLPSTNNKKNCSLHVIDLFEKINKLINKHFLLNVLPDYKIKQLTKPWITQEVCKSIKIKNHLLSSEDTFMYTYYRNKIITFIRISKRLYYVQYFESNKKQMRKIWDGINKLIHNKTALSNSITSLRDPVSNESL